MAWEGHQQSELPSFRSPARILAKKLWPDGASCCIWCRILEPLV